MREKGVVPALVGISAMALIASSTYSRKVHIQRPSMSVFQVGREVASLLKLGSAFMASGFFMMGAAYAVRIMVLRMISFEAAGFYQSAWTLGGLYVGFIFQAMGADFYPRLTGVAKDNAECNRLVNEQIQISLLLAGPGVTATLTFAGVVLELFYSAKFNAAVEILRWICLGMTLRIITWPIGFIILAKGASKFFFLSELAWTIVNVGVSWLGLRIFDLKGVGIAFFVSYVFHGLLIYPIVGKLSGFRWSTANWKTGLLFISMVAVVFCGFYVLPASLAMVIGSAAVISSGVYSIRALVRLVAVNRLPPAIRELLVRLRLVPLA